MQLQIGLLLHPELSVGFSAKTAEMLATGWNRMREEKVDTQTLTLQQYLKQMKSQQNRYILGSESLAQMITRHIEYQQFNLVKDDKTINLKECQTLLLMMEPRRAARYILKITYMYVHLIISLIQCF